MANEFSVQSALRVSSTDPPVSYSSPPNSTSFSVTPDAVKGPTPGELLIARAGTDISLAQITTPGPVVIHNRSTQTDRNIYFVEYGIWDSGLGRLFVLGEIWPGEQFVFRLARYLGEEHTNGTGTGAAATGNTLRLKAHGEDTRVLVEAWNR